MSQIAILSLFENRSALVYTSEPLVRLNTTNVLFLSSLLCCWSSLIHVATRDWYSSRSLLLAWNSFSSERETSTKNIFCLRRCRPFSVDLHWWTNAFILFSKPYSRVLALLLFAFASYVNITFDQIDKQTMLICIVAASASLLETFPAFFAIRLINTSSKESFAI